jgi:hypothetical protein
MTLSKWRLRFRGQRRNARCGHCIAEKEASDEPHRLAARDVRARARKYGRLSRVYTRLRTHLRATAMTYVTIAVTAAVIVYLFTALIRPEWF